VATRYKTNKNSKTYKTVNTMDPAKEKPGIYPNAREVLTVLVSYKTPVVLLIGKSSISLVVRQANYNRQQN
jgi:hypothetical protein